MKKVGIGLLMAFCLAGVALAAEWWEKKAYSEWSKREVKRMLDRSPWGKIHTITILNEMHTGERNFQTIGSGDLEREKLNHFHIRLLSAAPIRMALARDIVLKTKGDANQAALENLVQRRDEENIVLSINLTTEPAGADSRRFYWSALMSARTPDLAKNTFLATKTGKRVYLSHYMPPGEDGFGAKLFFPRKMPDGQPLITAADKGVKFETMLTLDRINPQDARSMRTRTDRIYANFKLSKMMFQGVLEF